MKHLKITIVTREQGELVDSVIDSILDDMFRESKPLPPSDTSFGSLKDTLEHKYLPEYDLHHAVCHQQHVGNFCGYHATFASIGCLQILERTQDRLDIVSPASFWHFKNVIEQFLLKYKHTHKLKEEWPWRERDILYGDFERTYNNVWKANAEALTQCYRHPDIEYIDHTWQFQFKNLICNQQSRRELNQKITYFQRFKRPGKMLVFTVMLAITNHWTCLVAIKHQGKSEFWFFDSKNLPYLNYSHTEIKKYIQELNEERVARGKEPYEKWREGVIESAMVDTQLSLKLLVKSLKGEENIDLYHYNRQFMVFAEQFEPLLALTNKQAFSQSLIEWVVSYKHDLRRFFNAKIHRQQLYPSNRELLDHMLHAFLLNFKKHREIMLLHDMARSKI